MVVRVVCGLRATIASLAPTRAFMSVDLPAFGRPRRDTNPETKPGFSATLIRRFLQFRNPDLIDAQLACGQHLDPYSLAFNALADLRHAPQPLRHQAADGNRLRLLVRPEIDQVAQMIEAEAARHDEAPVRVGRDVVRRFVLVANFPEDLFHQVFERRQSGRVPVFVDHHYHVRSVGLHLAQQIGDFLGLRHQANRAHQFAYRLPRALIFFQFEHIAHVDEADDVVDRLYENRNARVLFMNDQFAEIVERTLLADGYDLGPR